LMIAGYLCVESSPVRVSRTREHGR
jgi:hypothetical protein